MKTLITERDVIEARQRQQTELIVHPKAIITPAAADAASSNGIIINRSNPSSQTKHNSQHPNQLAKVVIGADHGGFELKEILKQHLSELGVEYDDVGTHSTDSVDYPDYAHLVAEKVRQSDGLLGIIIDGAGVGSAMAANKVTGIRAATCNDVYTARNSRLHNDANVLTLGSRVIGIDVAKGIVTVWLETQFEGGRHEHRVGKIMEIERKYRRG